MVDTRRSSSLPLTLISIRPSCGIRRSAISSLAIIFILVTIAPCVCLAGFITSDKSPSILNLILKYSSPGSMCISDALDWAACTIIVFTNLTTGALFISFNNSLSISSCSNLYSFVNSSAASSAERLE